MTETVIKIQNVSYSYTSSGWKLENLDLDINKGELIGIVGANGSGKSTLLKITANIISPENGSVMIENKKIKKIPRKKLAQKIGYLPQQVNPVFDFNVNEVVLMGRFCRSKGFAATTAEDIEIAEQCMAVTEVKQFSSRSINDLSGGERQRVMLASILAQQPEIMLLDEPVTGLDLHHQITFFKLLAKLSSKGMTVMVITHDLNLASQFCSKILLMDKGKKIICDSIEKVFRHIEDSQIYTRDASILKHPFNQKPALLPYYDPEQEQTNNEIGS